MTPDIWIDELVVRCLDGSEREIPDVLLCAIPRVGDEVVLRADPEDTDRGADEMSLRVTRVVFFEPDLPDADGRDKDPAVRVYGDQMKEA